MRRMLAAALPRRVLAPHRLLVFTQERRLTAFGSNRIGVWDADRGGDLACWAR